MPTPAIVTGADPVLRTVAAWAALGVPARWLPKASGLGVSVSARTAPVPVSGMLCGLPGALSFRTSAALRAPPAAGLNDTDTVHEAPAASVAGPSGQVVVWAKSPAFVPENPIELIVSGPLPELRTVSGCAALVLPTGWAAKPRLEGVVETAGALVGATKRSRMFDVTFLPAALATFDPHEQKPSL